MVIFKEYSTEKHDFYTDYYRSDDWHSSWVNILNNDGNVISFKTRTTTFSYISKLSKKIYSKECRVIIDDNNRIVWIGYNENKQYFISCGEKIYGLRYEYRSIQLFPNISLGNEYFDEENKENNDWLFSKYGGNLSAYKVAKIENAKKIFEEEKRGITISLEEYFEKDFFNKGLKWNENWDKYYGYNYITILIDIIIQKGLFCIEIENITYPFYGYILLDLNELKIIESKKL